MARLFDDALTQYLEVASCPNPGVPWSMSIWFYVDDLTADQSLMSMANSAEADEYCSLLFKGSNNTLLFEYLNTQGGEHNTAENVSINTWHHAFASIVATNNRSIWLDNGTESNNTVTVATPTYNAFGIGRNADSTPSDPLSGRAAEGAIWDATLTDGERAALAAGFSPLLIRPQSLIAYWPLIRNEDQDRVGGYDLTAYNTPTIAAHPPVIYPAQVFQGFTAGAVGDDYFRTVSDPIGVIDTLSIIANYYRSLSNTAVVSDELSKVLTAKRAIEDTADITDTVSTARGLIKTLTDTVGVTDAVTATVKIIVSIADAVGVTSTLSTIRDIVINIADNVGVTDLLSKIGTFFIRPDGDQSVGQWTDELDGTTNIYQSVDEPAPAIDSDYIQSPFAPQTQSYTCTLSDTLDPGINTGHTLSYRYRKFPVTNQQVDLTVVFLQGAVELIFWQHNNVASGWVTANQLIPSGIVGNITDYTDLRLEFEADIV